MTERPGRIRLIRNGKLKKEPCKVCRRCTRVARGQPAGLDGYRTPSTISGEPLVYFAYHKPAPGGEGATTLARGTWDGSALVDVRDIFESGATGTEASRIVFGRDGMLYMSISGPGSAPMWGVRTSPMITAAKSVPRRRQYPDNPLAGRFGYKPAYASVWTYSHQLNISSAIVAPFLHLLDKRQASTMSAKLSIDERKAVY